MYGNRLNVFRDYFADDTDKYVLIGGAACDIVFTSNIQTTMDIYAECTAEKKQEIFATLNGKIMIK